MNIKRGNLRSCIRAIGDPAFRLKTTDGFTYRNRADAEFTSKCVDNQSVTWYIDAIHDTLTKHCIGLFVFIGMSNAHRSLFISLLWQHPFSDSISYIFSL